MNKAEITWTNSQGKPIACVEKLKVLNSNWAELEQMIQDALDDAVLLGCTQIQVKQALHQLITNINSDFTEL